MGWVGPTIWRHYHVFAPHSTRTFSLYELIVPPYQLLCRLEWPNRVIFVIRSKFINYVYAYLVPKKYFFWCHFALTQQWNVAPHFVINWPCIDIRISYTQEDSNLHGGRRHMPIIIYSGCYPYLNRSSNPETRDGHCRLCSVTIRRGFESISSWPLVVDVHLVQNMDTVLLIVLYILIFGPCWAWFIFYVTVKCKRHCCCCFKKRSTNSTSSAGNLYRQTGDRTFRWRSQWILARMVLK